MMPFLSLALVFQICIQQFLSESFLVPIPGAFLGHVAQSSKKINPFLKVVCHSCVNFTLLILRHQRVYVSECVCVSVCEWSHLHGCMFRDSHESRGGV